MHGFGLLALVWFLRLVWLALRRSGVGVFAWHGPTLAWSLEAEGVLRWFDEYARSRCVALVVSLVKLIGLLLGDLAPALHLLDRVGTFCCIMVIALSAPTLLLAREVGLLRFFLLGLLPSRLFPPLAFSLAFCSAFLASGRVDVAFVPSHPAPRPSVCFV
jgi:hypothetical protein